MTDIFQHWKDNRFVVAPIELTDNERLVILTDIQYWNDQHSELAGWCNDRNAVTSGMTVVFGDEKTLVEFMLRWS
jgi:hypothetical protein